MSVQEIQNLYTLLTDLKAQVSGFIGESKAKDKEFDKHIVKDERWKENTENQLNAIANALLQDQTRDTIEKAVEDKTEQKSEKDKDTSSNKRLLWQTTIVLSIFSVITNLDKIFGFLSKIFSFLAG